VSMPFEFLFLISVAAGGASSATFQHAAEEQLKDRIVRDDRDAALSRVSVRRQRGEGAPLRFSAVLPCRSIRSSELCAAADRLEIGQRGAVLRPADGDLDRDQIVDANHANTQLLLRQ